MPPCIRVILLFCLTRDSDAGVKEAAIAAFSALPAEIIVEYIVSPDGHPAILDYVSRVFFDNSLVTKALLGNPELSSNARLLLEQREAEKVHAVEETSFDLSDAEEVAEIVEEVTEDSTSLDEVAPEEEYLEEELCQQTEEFLSKYQMAQVMSISEKIKMALTGDKEWRAILIKDANKLVSGSVIKNPRLSESEVLTILKVGVQNDEIIRLICANKEWVKNYKIRKALVDCHKTPLPNALRYLATLGEKDVAGYAKSKNISSVISTQAKRMLLAKKR
ncbi:hypothetical protein [Pelotalea chapellei]|uniref:HEAT repeat domain-containing protein n=1 Tax=Pelotalea chapellei TaxID=44671 RepID=A0ABS5UCU0_9BACT|nr:hypothetical protein [Pelotalea chapellei]MBT1073533.1 hypothetical protein [Pelotalea chapellei]